ncbi:MAG: NAD kinase [Prevotella sp.]|nr:NAD kinase [Prevotella sp.]
MATQNEETLRFALFGNTYQHEKSAAVRQVLNALRSHNAHIAIDKEYSEFLATSGLANVEQTATFTGSHFDADFAISMGGDGTLLKTASRVRDKQIPIVGINMGRLGFLANASTADVEECIDSLFNGDYSVEERALIHVETSGGTLSGYNCALNDVAILKRDTASMISIRASINGEHLAVYQADGLIVSTPTGSTAYSLSNGGPIIVPRTGVMLMTAVAGHSLNIRPIVIPDSAVIELTVTSRSHTFLVAIDGRSEKLPEGATLRLARAPYTQKVVTRRSTSYFSTLREKLMWGADVR